MACPEFLVQGIFWHRELSGTPGSNRAPENNWVHRCYRRKVHQKESAKRIFLPDYVLFTVQYLGAIVKRFPLDMICLKLDWFCIEARLCIQFGGGQEPDYVWSHVLLSRHSALRRKIPLQKYVRIFRSSIQLKTRSHSMRLRCNSPHFGWTLSSLTLLSVHCLKHMDSLVNLKI
jgi:hypothetical protein